jgi:hypothetical protein
MATNCPCLSSLIAFGIAGDLKVTIQDVRFTLPRGYGQSLCFPHDLWLEPYCLCGEHGAACNDGEQDLRIPTFCARNWCYVNGSSCGQTSFKTSYDFKGLHDPEGHLHYSYHTCDDCDEYSATIPLVGTSCMQRQVPLADEVIAIIVVLSIVGAAALLASGFCYRRHLLESAQLRELLKARLRYASDGTNAVPRPLSEMEYHLFLSHAWQSGQDQMRHVKHVLSMDMLPGMKVFLDVRSLCPLTPRLSHRALQASCQQHRHIRVGSKSACHAPRRLMTWIQGVA